MRFLKPDEADALYEKETAGCTDTGLYPHWMKVKNGAMLGIVAGTLLYANLVIKKHTDAMYSFFHVTEKWKMLLCWAIFMAVWFVASTAAHELLHVIVLPHKLKNVRITLDLPHTVSISTDAWETKAETLVSLLAPVVGISLLVVLPLCLCGHPVLGGLLMICNVGGSSSDIYAFFYLLKTLPKDAMTYGNRYQTRAQYEAGRSADGQAKSPLEALYLKQYAGGREETRLFSSKANETEFTVTMHYIRKYLKPGARIIDIGAGAGAYAKALAKEGCSVDALDLHPDNVAKMRSLFEKTESVRVFQADARDLSEWEDDAFDLALLMGPVYHLHKTEDRIRAVAEAVRVVKPGAPVFAAFCLQDAPLLQFVFQSPEPSETLKTVGYDRETATVTENTGSSIKLDRLTEVNALTDRICEELPVERGLLFAQEGLSHVLRDNVNDMSEASYRDWIEYLTATAERPDLMGYSNHVVQIFIKK